MPRKRSHTRRVPKASPSGILQMHPEGYGFVRTAEGEFYVPSSKTGFAFHGDLVEVVPLPRKSAMDSSGDAVKAADRPAAYVARVLQRNIETVVGRYEIAEPFGVVVPDDPRMQHDIFTMLADNAGIPDGAIVRVRLTTYPGKKCAATGIVEEVLALEDGHAVDMELIIARHNLYTTFSNNALDEAASVELDIPDALSKGYSDIRDRFVFTIDPEDAKDFDDAVSLEVLQEEGECRYRIGVHIADVSAYVPWNGFMDLEARKRGCSVYMADRVIPMLPEELSNDLCSLKPHVDRLCMTVDMVVNRQGVVYSVHAYPSIMHSRARLTYEQAQDILLSEGEASCAGISASEMEKLQWRIKVLSSLAKKRHARRLSQGGLDFNSPEVRAVLGSDGVATGYKVRRKTDATELIEEAMIMCNEAIAGLMVEHKRSTAFRIHEQPASENLEALIPVLREFSWFEGIDEYHFVQGDPKVLGKVLELSEGSDEEEMVSSLLLRSMKRAVYSPVNIGHYGLASTAYLHFTSPIRRYPDLMAHRMLKEYLFGHSQGMDADVNAQIASLAWICEHSSEMERVAERVQRESQECKLLGLLEHQRGHVLTGIVSGVTSYGLYVRLENSLEGLVSLSDLGREYFTFDPKRYSLTGEDSLRRFRLGDALQVMVKSIDVRCRNLELKLAQRDPVWMEG